MELLITRSVIPHFYRVDQGMLEELVPLNFSEHEIGQPTLKIKHPLPWEICSPILHYLFYSHLKDHNYDLAAALTWINKRFGKEIYDKIYGKSVISPATRVKRMCSSMYTLERIHDDYLTLPRISRFPACRLIKTGLVTKYSPWTFVLDCFPISLAGVVQSDNEPVQQYEVGPLNGDIVWLSGRYLDNGIYECKRFKHPIINLEICNYADDNQVTSLYLRRNKPFRSFVQLLIQAYGPNTGVHVSFDDSEHGNPFDVSGRGFIEF